jgi:hypothetical protein
MAFRNRNRGGMERGGGYLSYLTYLSRLSRLLYLALAYLFYLFTRLKPLFFHPLAPRFLKTQRALCADLVK